MSVELVITGKVLDWVEKDLHNLVARDPSVRFECHDLVWASRTVYRPPGCWCRFTGDRTASGSRLLWWFPEPYHPLEVLAAYRGMGGVKTTRWHSLRGEDWAAIEDLEKVRYAGWVKYTDLIAKHLFLFPAQVRVLYHALTPLQTNGCEWDTTMAVAKARMRLYKTVFPDCPVTKQVRVEGQARGADRDTPIRMEFWEGEVTGRIEL